MQPGGGPIGLSEPGTLKNLIPNLFSDPKLHKQLPRIVGFPL